MSTLTQLYVFTYNSYNITVVIEEVLEKHSKGPKFLL